MMDVSRELSQKLRNMALLCSFLVVVIHSISNFHIDNALLRFGVYDGFCRVAVPFFFFASGFFLAGHVGERGWWRDALAKRVRTLGIPYFLWIALYILFSLMPAIFENISHGRALFSQIDYPFGQIVKDFGFYPLAHPKFQPLWYVRALFILVLLSPFFVCLIRSGMAYRMGALRLKLNRANALAALCCGGGLMIAKIILHSHGEITYTYFGWLSVPFLSLGIVNLMSSATFPAWLTSCAFPVYLVHMFFLRFVVILLEAVNVVVSEHLWLWACIAVLVFVASVSVVALQRRLWRGANVILWGGR